MSIRLQKQSKQQIVEEKKFSMGRRGLLLCKSMEKTIHRMTAKPSARYYFVEAEVATALAHQIRAIRQQRGWSQKELADKLKTTQTVVSRWEDPSYGRLTLKTLLELSKAFDVGLQVRFTSLIRQIKDTWVVKRSELEVESFENEVQYVAYIDHSASAYLKSETVHGAKESPSGAVSLLPVGMPSTGISYALPKPEREVALMRSIDLNSPSRLSAGFITSGGDQL